jgi:hypothetical protein
MNAERREREKEMEIDREREIERKRGANVPVPSTPQTARRRPPADTPRIVRTQPRWPAIENKSVNNAIDSSPETQRHHSYNHSYNNGRWMRAARRPLSVVLER